MSGGFSAEWPQLRHTPTWADVEATQDLVYPQRSARATGRAQPVTQRAVADQWDNGSYRLTVWSNRLGAPVELQVTDRAASLAQVPSAAADRLLVAGWQVLGDWCRYGDGWQVQVVHRQGAP